MDHVVVLAGEVALGPLDLDHPGAGVGEAAGGQRRGHRLLQRHHKDPLQRPWHQNDLGSPSTWVATCDRIRFVGIGAVW